MKTYIFLLLVYVISFNAAIAQDGTGQFRAAKKALLLYNMDNTNTAKLIEAKKAIDMALVDPNYATVAMVWLLSGEIHQKIGEQHNTVHQTGVGKVLQIPSLKDPVAEAMKAYKKVMNLSLKKYQKMDALEGIRVVQDLLNNAGIIAYGNGDYHLTYKKFNEVLLAHELLTSEGKESSLTERKKYLDLIYFTGLTALYTKKNKEAKTLFLELYDSGYNKADVYESLYKISAEESGSSAKTAYKYLEEGRKLFPQDTGLLFAEINYFLRVGTPGKAIKNLRKAILLEPENITIYNTLGNVYDNLYQIETQGGNKGAAVEYFMEAQNAYSTSLEKDPNNFDANYSLGALYYNKAALEIKILNNLTTDMSAEGTRKYDMQNGKVTNLMKKSLPYFKKAEKLDANQISTLSALKEIYAFLDDLEMSRVFKERLEIVQGGGRNAASYFQQ